MVEEKQEQETVSVPCLDLPLQRRPVNQKPLPVDLEPRDQVQALVWAHQLNGLTLLLTGFVFLNAGNHPNNDL